MGPASESSLNITLIRRLHTPGRMTGCFSCGVHMSCFDLWQMPGTRIPGYSKINARPNESRCSLLEKEITIIGVRSAAPSSPVPSIGRPHRTSGLALELLDCQDEGESGIDIN
jgi:hypothetical protein